MIRFLYLILTICSLAAHEVSESFLRINATSHAVTGVWEVSLRDLEVVIGLDENRDDQLTRGEIADARPKLETLVERSLQFPGAESPARLLDFAISRKTSGNFLALTFHAGVPANWSPAVNYDFMFPFDREHRAIVSFICEGTENVSILTAGNAHLSAQHSAKFNFIEFMRQGIVHIWSGTDHILFLLALLLPTVVTQKAPNLSLRSVLLRVAKIVTAFTVAHSITLALATLGLVRLPSRAVESVIAFSVMLAAANNIAKIWNDRSWLLAFAFGLIHGFGFASALSELQLQRANIASALVGFNGGVEIGQLAIVALFIPMAFVLRNTSFYRRVAVVGGSTCIIAIAGAWLVERAFAVTVFSFASTLPR